ncbi:hypothetical protein BpHYR1_010611 [Brachionus plicatilis]|uniref:Uncharacterized protein n=1 Tax=Brachionus plicatilis TaxID=10195 RepID=A0A3M7S6I4_BRAPC|nr:hypothetical protein BpHYR1_010611 [Brachionus plicatilis]
MLYNLKQLASNDSFLVPFLSLTHDHTTLLQFYFLKRSVENLDFFFAISEISSSKDNFYALALLNFRPEYMILHRSYLDNS